VSGKDLTEVELVVGIGGVLVNAENPNNILEGSKADKQNLMSLKPKSPKYLLDKKYIFASMGLLCSLDAELALAIMKKEIT
jgi:uncharacterized protein (TIGR01319 family)